IELTITIPAADVKKAWDQIVEETVKNTVLPGFRKGKAPKKLAEEKLDKEKVKEEVIKKLLPQFYAQAVNEHQLTPIIYPKVHLRQEDLAKDLSSGQHDLQVIAQTCETPEISLNGYKDSVRKITAKTKIIVPGKVHPPAKFEDIVKALLDSVKVKIPQMLVETEVDRLLSQTLDEIKKLGLTLDQYLTSTGKTAEGLRGEYRAKAETDLKLEFTLRKIAEEEKITVNEQELDEAIKKAQSEEERKNLTNNRYLLASILRQQKTLDFIKNL
ncbi:hypothetical protein HYS29_01480, partial [Candidatus Microgenomates bacterium]|nr:hypothetical protein [Candidatus Microgenomates bacterium]